MSTPPVLSVFLATDPAACVLTTYRKDGTAASSPVWFRAIEERIEVVVAEDDIKLKRLTRRPECSLLVFETAAPFRGFRIEAAPVWNREAIGEARTAIASRYLGADHGIAFAQQRGAGVVLTWSLGDAKAWDLTGILP